MDDNDDEIEVGGEAAEEGNYSERPNEPWPHNPWDFECVKRVHGEPWRDRARCHVCRPEERFPTLRDAAAERLIERFTETPAWYCEHFDCACPPFVLDGRVSSQEWHEYVMRMDLR